MHTRPSLTLALAMVLVFLPMSPGWAQDSFEEKPFAEVRVVLQLSDQQRESVVLDVANNLIRHYGGPDFIDIEIVTFGPGVRLLYADSPHAVRIASLVDNGVRFYVCENTLDTMERNNGSRPKLSPHAISVQAGVAHIIEKVEEGFTLVRP
ncbi:MAG: DsrE family protein [Proteobacteria bacterium]|nr:DsrE family protein [Pseudomonadota bacterium]